MNLKYKIVITGGSGRFGSILQKKYQSINLFRELFLMNTILTDAFTALSFFL